MPTLPPSQRPNIVWILMDDMGFSDIGCYGSEIRTPNLDGLARGGLRFSQMYNAGRCCPSRASLLTGLYPHQAGVGNMVHDCGVGPAYQGFLRDDCVTIAETLRDAGYRTCMSGKWHVGGVYSRHDTCDWTFHDPRRPLPPDRGFDDWYGTPAGAGSYFNPKPLFRNHRIVEPEGPDYYYTDAVSHEACRMIEDSARDGRPFFLYVAYTAPHWPLHAPEEDVARYENAYREGWDALRTARHEQLKGMGILSSAWAISPRDPQSLPWGEAPLPDWEQRRMAVYAAQIARADRGIGRIVDTLRKTRVGDNTILFFLSDNGGCHELLNEDGQKAREWPTTLQGRPVRFGNRTDIPPGAPDTYQSYGRAWANASNSPFRLFKHWVHEGGIATPLIVHAPAFVPCPGIVHPVCHIVDLVPTCLEAAGVSHPSERAGRKITPLEGESFLPLLRGRTWTRERPVFWEHEGNCALRDGDWKLVRKHPDGWELYHMERDRTELADRADREPDRLRRMVGLWEDFARRVGALPWEEVRRRKAQV